MNTNLFKGKKVIIFDMDGTLIDSVGIWNKTDEILIGNFNANIKRKADINEMFSVVLSKEDVQEKKPSPEVHNKIMQLLGVSPSECLIIEDSLIGVQAGKNARIEVAVMYDKYSDGDREEINKLADYRFSSFDEVINQIVVEKGEER